MDERRGESSGPEVRERAVYALAALGFVLRLVLASVSRGSNDAGLWEEFGWQISQFGLRSLYENDSWFIHPPLMGGWAYLCFEVSQNTYLPFAPLMKIPGLLGDLGVAWLLRQHWRAAGTGSLGVPLAAWIVLAYAFDLDAILISGFHGNTDSLCVMFCLWAFSLQGRERPLAAGLALAAALNVKLLPVLCVPLLLLRQRSWRDALRFSRGLLLGLVPFLYLLPSAAIAAKRILTYGSGPEHWGLIAFLDFSTELPVVGELAASAAAAYHADGRYVLLTLFIALGVVQRFRSCWSDLELGALAFAGFLVFAPGFGIQYTVYAVPFLYTVHMRTAVLYGLGAGIFAATLYLAYWTGGWPWFSMFTGPYPMPVPLLGVVPWFVLAQFFARTLEQGLRRGRSRP